MTDLNNELFGLLVLSLGNAALVGLAEVPNPETQLREKNLNLAKENINLLEMLHQKTKGNLSQGEDQLLEDLLYDLHMKYVEATKNP